MFSSEQIFEVSGDMDQLEMTIKFAISMYNKGKNDITYQITKDGKYCLGWYADGNWKNFPFDFDPHIVAEIVKQHLEKQECEDTYSWSDGSSEKGFDEPVLKFYDNKGEVAELYYRPQNKSITGDTYKCPTFQMAMKWLREVHKWHIEISRGEYGYFVHVVSAKNLSTENYTVRLEGGYNLSYEEACEAAIKYCLENLI